MTDPRKRAQWMIENDSRKFIERELGMSLGDAKTLLSTAKATAGDYAQRQWESLCSKHGLDPNNREVAEMVSGLVQGANLDRDTALQRAAKFYGKPAEAETTAASVETTSQTSTMSNERIVPRNRKHARELAEKGINIGNIPMHELIRDAVSEEEKRAGPQRIRTLS
jgi:hypothetical protein